MTKFFISLSLFLSVVELSTPFHIPIHHSTTTISQCQSSTQLHSTNESNEVDRKSFLSSSITAATIATTTLLSTSPSIYPSSTSAANAAETGNDSSSIATFALRRAGAVGPSITKLKPNKNGIFVRLGEQMLYSNDGSRTPGKDIFCSFDFPADWLQLDRFLGGLQYVDQRNGDKLYVLKVKMPEGVENLKEVPKVYFGNAIFDPKGELVRNGNDIEEYKVLSSQMLSSDNDGDDAGGASSSSSSSSSSKEIPRRRLKVKYTTLTGNNYAVERKGIVDAYEFGGMVYMLLTGSNAVLFDKKGRERETAEYIADSFRVQAVYTGL